MNSGYVVLDDKQRQANAKRRNRIHQVKSCAVGLLSTAIAFAALWAMDWIWMQFSGTWITLAATSAAGFVCLIGPSVVLWLGARKTARERVLNDFVRENCETVSASPVDRAMFGRIVHVQAELASEDTLKIDTFCVPRSRVVIAATAPKNSARLRIIVEEYKDIGTGDAAVYGFGEHTAVVADAQQLTFGDFNFTEGSCTDLVAGLRAWNWKSMNLVAWHASLGGILKGSRIYLHGADPDVHCMGDLRLGVEYMPCGPLSIIGTQVSTGDQQRPTLKKVSYGDHFRFGFKSDAAEKGKRCADLLEGNVDSRFFYVQRTSQLIVHQGYHSKEQMLNSQGLGSCIVCLIVFFVWTLMVIGACFLVPFWNRLIGGLCIGREPTPCWQVEQEGHAIWTKKIFPWVLALPTALCIGPLAAAKSCESPVCGFVWLALAVLLLLTLAL